MVADATGRPYQAFRTLAEAQADPDGVVVFEGDDGGQVYLVCPARAVHCSEEALRFLLKEIDSRQWNDPSAARIYFERLPVGSPVPGGMGGGRVTDGLWLHPRLRDGADAIGNVLRG
jgi:hypothetical protein